MTQISTRWPRYDCAHPDCRKSGRRLAACIIAMFALCVLFFIWLERHNSTQPNGLWSIAAGILVILAPANEIAEAFIHRRHSQ